MQIIKGDPVTPNATHTGFCQCGAVLDLVDGTPQAWLDRHTCPGKFTILSMDAVAELAAANGRPVSAQDAAKSVTP